MTPEERDNIFHLYVCGTNVILHTDGAKHWDWQSEEGKTEDVYFDTCKEAGEFAMLTYDFIMGNKLRITPEQEFKEKKKKKQETPVIKAGKQRRKNG